MYAIGYAYITTAFLTTLQYDREFDIDTPQINTHRHTVYTANTEFLFLYVIKPRPYRREFHGKVMKPSEKHI